MAIIITSLTPVSPVVTAGSTVTFSVLAQEEGSSLPLQYEWQYSTNGGITYSSSGLFNNTDSQFTTSPLSQNQSGIYYRVKITNQSGDTVVYSNEVSGIGNRIVTITAAPIILLLDEYQPSYTVAVAANLNLVVEVALENVDITTATNYSSLLIEWQQSTDNGNNWTTVTSGTFGQFTYDIVTTTQQISTSPSAYTKKSILTLSNITFDSNNYRYRARITYPGASNTPTVVTETVLLVNPTISIFQQPGINAADTKIPVQCYKTSISNSGLIRVSVGAFTTAGQSLAYSWQYAIVGYDNIQTEWESIDDGITNYHFRLQTGTTSNSDVLQLQRAVYYEKFAFRCIISGSSGEIPVTSESHYIFMKDVEVQPTALTDKQSLEDYYDPIDVPNDERYLYTQYPIQTVIYESEINIAKNTGLNGIVTLQYQRQSSGSSTWADVGDSFVNTPTIIPYVALPVNTPQLFDFTYTTPPVRINSDNQSKYRIKITSTALYTLDNGVKTLVPYYSNVSTLTVYRGVYIVTQPTSATIYSTQSVSFLVGAATTSSATISYQWQHTESLTTAWTNITNGGIYSGATTNLLLLTSVSGNLTKKLFRCVVSAAGALSTVTSNDAKLTIAVDSFTTIGSLNDYSVNEFQLISWVADAQSLSLGAIQYQWQKSTNFSPSNPSAAVWNNIVGETSNTFSIPSVVKTTDEGYYRCRFTSIGGEVAFTNAARLTVSFVRIDILTNTPSTASILEGAEDQIRFTVQAIATVGPPPTYQWQIKRIADSSFSDIGVGYRNQVSTGSSYIPKAFDRLVDNGAKIRCAITADEVPGVVYSNECTITVDRRFYYFADTATKTVSLNGNFSLNLSPSYTGGIPTFQWQRSTNGGSTWSNISGETSSELFVSNVTNAINNYRYRCEVTLTECTQFQYSRNNLVTIQTVNGVGYTQTVTLSLSSLVSKPKYYSRENEKTGAAIGTVICVPKPGSYVNDAGAVTDDIASWKTAVSGDISNTGTTSSVVASGSIFNANKPSWVTNSDYRSPKWVVADDRFPGFIELRGQWLVKSEFRALYSIIGDIYGSTTTLFKLPNPYGKKLMGTGNVNNNGGNVSIVPLYDPTGIFGGDKNVAGSVGGVWNYSKSAQLPPGSPGNTSDPDGTAGVNNAATFTIGNYSTTGFADCEGIANTNFSGKFTFTVGPLLTSRLNSTPPHTHVGVSAGYVQGFSAFAGNCSFRGRGGSGLISPTFYGIDSGDGVIFAGPEGIADNDRGISHSHGLTFTPSEAGNGSSNHNDGIGDTTSTTSVTTTVDLENNPSSSNQSLNLFLEPAPIVLSDASRFIFNSSLRFYLKNNEELPVNSNYFRLKYMIKAY